MLVWKVGHSRAHGNAKRIMYGILSYIVFISPLTSVISDGKKRYGNGIITSFESLGYGFIVLYI